ncbi:uncharacterized protein LOC118738430 [Rhagoletis pomonella]|uniref:uncharacterized protein LOC118738430 n=1 Tax=Rhagoletis pomonella TaxID=28610 RepID=UPI001780A5A3|nr:uncharacterized protein LOC118738430 [Rhagoletis pomonella]
MKCGLEITRGRKGKLKLFFAGYEYLRNFCKGPKTYWLCARNREIRCHARVITSSRTGELVIRNPNHNHTPPEQPKQQCPNQNHTPLNKPKQPKQQCLKEDSFIWSLNYGNEKE